MREVPKIMLRSGAAIPQLGFGTYQIKPEETERVVREALEIGYRHIDTAEMYKNEVAVGKAVQASGIPREDIFITTKLSNDNHNPADAEKAFHASLEALGGEYIDLFLIHWPLPTKYDGDFISTWQVFEKLHSQGLVKSIGVSNFQVDHLEALLASSGEIPVVNQIEIHPYFQNETVVTYCQDNDIAIEAWSPIAQGGVLDDPVITAIAETHAKTPAQIVLRWHIQNGYIIFPKSVTPERIAENFAIFDFSLTTEEMIKINELDKQESGRTGPHPEQFDYIPV